MATTYCRRVQHHARPAVVAASQNSVRSVKCTQEKPRPPRVKSDGSDGGTALQFSMVRGDLFSCPGTASLAHCISADMRMGKGIAVEFKKRYGHVEELKEQRAEAGGVAVLKHHGAFVFYLVTKQRYFHKPTYESLESSLRSLSERCVASDVKELCMPTIGCGLDGLNWKDVEQMIKRIFNDVSISITIYYL
ncbi:hypothetical protein EMCRGX_G000275 [Ephydatia muelleri]|eukprot:Em0001g187a